MSDSSRHLAYSEPDGAMALDRYMERLPTAFAVVRGPARTVVSANAAFRRLTAGSTGSAIGGPMVDAFPGHDASGLVAALDHAMRTGVVLRDRYVGGIADGAASWCCTVWPHAATAGSPAWAVVELREATAPENVLAFQQEVAERMVLSAMRERDLADVADRARSRATFLAAEGHRLAESLDETTTKRLISEVSLQNKGSWCIVDLLDEAGTMTRLNIVHPAPEKQALAQTLGTRWAPTPGDPFGLPAMLRGARPLVIAADVDAALVATTHDAETLATVRALGAGPLLTVPLVIRDQLIGAITFVALQPDRVYGAEDIALAQDLATRSALALDSARLHGNAIALTVKAESASRAKSAFLGTMSHELRTPLNAIGGYVDLIEMGLRGPVTETQRADLLRIRRNQQHLTALVTDILNLVRLGGGAMQYHTTDVAVRAALLDAVAMVEPLLLEKQLELVNAMCEVQLAVRADREKLTQILVNLLSNAVKFTPAGGQVTVDCGMRGADVLLHVTDSGIGIPADKLSAVFEPFMQVRSGLAGRDSGVGLGLAISCDLAHGMGGELTVESVLGEGSTFTLSLPVAAPVATLSDATVPVALPDGTLG